MNEFRQNRGPPQDGHARIQARTSLGRPDTAEAPPTAMDSVGLEPTNDMTNVLVVDDDMSVRYIVAETLRDENFTVTVAENGLEALHLLEEGLDPDALVLDLAMPVMD